MTSAIFFYQLCGLGIVDRQLSIDPATHMGGGKADNVRWIAQGPTYQNQLVCLRSSGTPVSGGHFPKWPPMTTDGLAEMQCAVVFDGL